VNHYDQGGYASFDLKMIDCREQTVSINNPGTPMEAIIFINSSTPYNYTLHHKFSSSHELFCPITSFNITRIEDAYSEQDVLSAFDALSIGTSENPMDYNFWHNLVLMDTSRLFNYNIYIEASSGNATSPKDQIILKLRVIKVENIAPYFMEDLES
tara:strand:- start:297 stop:764 length:468 start_codon:yes stop_codon:yes gene_type:complete